jgi:hypothetical protein
VSCSRTLIGSIQAAYDQPRLRYDEYTSAEVTTLSPLTKHPTARRLQELWDAFQALASLLLQIMGAALGMPEDWAVEAVRTQGITNMVAAHYPAADEAPPPGTLRVAPHSDTSVLTGAPVCCGSLLVLRSMRACGVSSPSSRAAPSPTDVRGGGEARSVVVPDEGLRGVVSQQPCSSLTH